MKFSIAFHKISAGGLFHPSDDNQELAFRQAVDRINADRSILPRSKLVAQIERISPFDSFHAGKRGECRRRAAAVDLACHLAPAISRVCCLDSTLTPSCRSRCLHI